MGRSFFLGLMMVTACTASAEPNSMEPTADETPTQPQALVVELFTSQGCSSCPPADKLLTELAAMHPGTQILPLAYHVDYWNYLGWQDPFSRAQWSERQRKYAKHLPHGRVYTPMLALQGQDHVVGSVRRKVEHAFASLQVTGGGSIHGRLDKTGDTWTVHLRARGAAQVTHVMVALYERDLITQVTRGENSGRELHYDYVVQRLDRAFELGPKEEKAQTFQIPIPTKAKRENLGVTVFLQRPNDMAIVAAAPASTGE